MKCKEGDLNFLQVENRKSQKVTAGVKESRRDEKILPLWADGSDGDAKGISDVCEISF